jgi:hypothetical protein
MKVISALLVAAMCIQISGTVKLKSKGLSDSVWDPLPGTLATVDIAEDNTMIGTNLKDEVVLKLAKFGLRSNW